MRKANSFDHYVTPGKPNECHVWRGGRISTGYGAIRINGQSVLAHRVAWEREHGPIPEGMQVCHKCDNPPCVNPRHLFLGTAKDNADDRDRKGRTHRKLDKRAIANILKLRSKGLSQAAIAEVHEVSKYAIFRILRLNTRRDKANVA